MYQRKITKKRKLHLLIQLKMYKLKLVAKINIKKLNVSTKNLYTLVPVDMTVNNSILTTFEIAEMRKK